MLCNMGVLQSLSFLISEEVQCHIHGNQFLATVIPALSRNPIIKVEN